MTDSTSHPSAAVARTEREYLLKLQQAVANQEQGNISAAKVQYQELLDRQPDHYLALSFMGSLECEHGDIIQGEKYVRASIDSEPAHWAARNNLGNILLLQNKINEARDQFLLALQYKENAIDPLLNLGYLSLHKKDIEQADRYFKRAHQLDNNHPKVNRGLAIVYEHQNRPGEAITRYAKIVQQHPRRIQYLHEYAALFGRLKQADNQIEIYRKILTLSPSDPQATHMIAALAGESALEKASADYIRDLFNDFSSSFDKTLTSLGYHVPDLIAIKANEFNPSKKTDKILDAGCGTGMCGEQLRSLAKQLVGIDLSKGMLKRAKALGIYDELHETEIVHYLKDVKNTFDLIVSADTLCYFGCLDAFLKNAHQALKDSSALIFSVESLPDNTQSYKLEPHGRFSHSESYLRTSLKIAGFSVSKIETITVRMENKKPALGYLVIADKN